MLTALLIALMGSAISGSAISGSADFEAELKQNVDLRRLQKDLASLGKRLINTPEVKAEIVLLEEAYAKSINKNRNPVNGSSRNDEYIHEINKKSGYLKYLFEGDIILTSDQLSIIENALLSNRSRRQAMKNAGYSWGSVNPVIPYSYSDGYAKDRRPTIEAAMKFWEQNTCVRFKYSTSGYRLEVRDLDGCASDVGMTHNVKGTQGIYLGQGCISMGAITHELSHTFGFFHVQSRDDRDEYVDINYGNIDEEYIGEFKKETSEKTTLHEIPYEFGSVMHYHQKEFARNKNMPSIYAKEKYKIYQHSMTRRLPSFYDILAVNRHFDCFKRCKRSITCENGGVQDVNNCDKCMCPLGWAGDKCNERPARTETINVNVTPETKRYTLRGAMSKTDYTTQHYLLKAPKGMQIHMTPTHLGELASNTCKDMGIEVKFADDVRLAGLQVCDWDVNYPTIKSATNEMLVQAFTLGEKLIFEMEYKAAKNAS